jgi:hypothetical protein
MNGGVLFIDDDDDVVERKHNNDVQNASTRVLVPNRATRPTAPPVLDLTLDDDEDDDDDDNNINNVQEINEYDVHSGARHNGSASNSAGSARHRHAADDDIFDIELELAMQASMQQMHQQQPIPSVQLSHSQPTLSQRSQLPQQPQLRQRDDNPLADMGRSVWSSAFEPTPSPPTVASTSTKATKRSASSQPTSSTAEEKAAKKAAAAAAKADAKAEAAAKRAAEKAAKKKKSRSDMLAEMVLCVDTRLVEQADGAVILSELQSNGVTCRVRQLPIPARSRGCAPARRRPSATSPISLCACLATISLRTVDRRTIEQMVRDAKRHYGADVQLVVIIEGLDKAVTRDEQNRTRVMAANVRLLTAGNVPQPAEPAFDRMGQFVELEMSGVVVHEARTAAASAEYVVSFTRVLSERPYRPSRRLAASAPRR